VRAQLQAPRTRIAIPAPEERTRGPAGGGPEVQTADTRSTLFVLLSDGRTETVPGYKGLELTAADLIVLGEDGALAHFRRADVYSASRSECAPPPS
jgi:hypothetical protein